MEAGAPASIPEALTSGVRFARVTRSGIYVALAKRGVRPLTTLGIPQHSYAKRALYGVSIPDILLRMFEYLEPVYPLFLLLLAIVVLALVAKVLVNLIAGKNESNSFPYTKKESIMTPSEQKYFRKLEREYGQNHYIFCQVALDRIINTTDQKNFFTYWNKINKKSIDFVIVDKQTLQTVKLIELNDYTHSSYKRKQRDEYLRKVCEVTGTDLMFVSL